jgi:2-polyprenyl-3-methyl-5-hydroxy-6-metoxy-1,4-benzoquinol methylase
MLAPDTNKLEQLQGKLVGDLTGCYAGALAMLGDRLGLYRAMADGHPVSSKELASRTQTNERNVREWLAAQAAAGYVEFNDEYETFSMTAEQIACFADEESTAFFMGAFEVAQSMFKDEPKVAEAFRGTGALAWHDHSQCLFRGVERFFKPGYTAHLVAEWLPSLGGVVEKLKSGAKVADVGCGHGASTLIMARAFPNSKFVGYDYHKNSIDRAHRAAEQEKLSHYVSFATASAKAVPAGNYDLVCMFDCLHDMGDPVGALKHLKTTLGPDGVLMIVEPAAQDCLKDNLNPVGQLYYGASTMICTPGSLAQEVGLALGAQAGEAALRRVAQEAGFTRFKKAAETPFNFVFEVRA